VIEIEGYEISLFRNIARHLPSFLSLGFPPGHFFGAVLFRNLGYKIFEAIFF